MADLNEFVQEAVRKAIADDVEGKVYDKIKGDFLKLKFLGGAGAVLILIFGLYHQQVFSWIVSYGKTEFFQTLDDVAKKGEALQSKLEITRNLIESDVMNHRTHFNEQKRELTAFQAELNASVHEAQDLHDGLVDSRNALAERTASSQSAASEAQAQLKVVQSRLDEGTARIDAL